LTRSRTAVFPRLAHFKAELAECFPNKIAGFLRP